MKMVSVSLSTECVKKPRCSFCYNARLGPYLFDKYAIQDTLREIAKSRKIDTVCFEYSGYNLTFLFSCFNKSIARNITMTTMPQLITETLCGAIKSCGISAVALSYDREKCTETEWIKKAQMLKSVGFKVSCNFLITGKTLGVPAAILTSCDQLNLLIKKPVEHFKKEQKTFMNFYIEYIKGFNVPVVVDNCLGIELGLTKDCHAGKEFLHVLPNGKLVHCIYGYWCPNYSPEKISK